MVELADATSKVRPNFGVIGFARPEEPHSHCARLLGSPQTAVCEEITPLFEKMGPDKLKGIDIMRVVRSFDPCLPCGAHMFNGKTKLLEARHAPMFGVHDSSNALQPTEGMR